MRILNSNIDLPVFFRRVKKESQKALLIDYDGTLAPFQVERNRAFPYPGVREMLEKLVGVAGLRVVIVSGRWIKELKPLLKLKKQPEIWGSHGLERLKPDGSYQIASMDEAVLSGLVAADEWVEAVGLAKHSERKPGCIAIHWRGLDQRKQNELRARIEPEWSIIAKGSGLTLKEFDGGIELRPGVQNKGDAVRTVLEEMDGGIAAAYFGDNSTDEDAFIAIKGKGIGVLVREELKPTAADVWIKPPDELLQVLHKWLPDN
jgi:trehalose 6-phosphate phosphatase